MEMYKMAEEKESKRKQVQSNIVCKFFLDAIQKKVYGIQWECPNGDQCQYRHCLPKDYVLKTKKDTMQEEMTLEEFCNLEEQIDEERTRVSRYGKPVNEANYNEWRRERDERRMKIRSQKEKDLANKTTGIQLFKNSGLEIKDDEGATDIVIEKDLVIDVAHDIIDKDQFFKSDHKDDGIK